MKWWIMMVIAGFGLLITLVTAALIAIVHYTKSKGRMYFTFVRPFHRTFLPFTISQMVQ